MLTPIVVALILAQAPRTDLPMPPPPKPAAKTNLEMPPPPPGMKPKAPPAPNATAPAAKPPDAAAAKPRGAKPTAASAAAAAKEVPIKLAALELTGLNLDQKETSFYSEHVAQQLAFQGIRVTTSKEINTLIGFERQKTLLNCNEESASCVAELANALGVDCILTGDIGKFGTKYQITLKVLSANDARVLSAHSARVNGDEALLDELSRAARRMGPEIGKKMGRTLVKAGPDLEERPLKIPWAWVAIGTGAVLAGGGGYSMSQAADRYKELVSHQGQISNATADTLRRDGVTFQSLGYVGIGVGMAAVAGGVTLLFLQNRPAGPAGPGGPAAPAPTAVLVPSPNGDGWMFSLSGVLP